MKKSLKWKVAQSLEWRWWNNYLQKKDKTEYLQWKRNYWQGVLDQITPTLSIQKDMKILDAGCGPAGIFLNFPQHKMVAIDPLLDQYEKELAHFDPTDYPNVKFQCLPLEEFQNQGSFDIVFCMNAINHVSDLALSFQRLSDAVAPNGQLVVTIDAHNFQTFKKFLRLMPVDALHPHQYDLAEYEQMVLPLGYQTKQTLLLQKNFFFDHYLFVFQKTLIE